MDYKFDMVVGWHPSQVGLDYDDDSNVQVVFWSVFEVLETSRGPTKASLALEDVWAFSK